MEIKNKKLFKDLTGQTISYLTVISIVGKSPCGSYIWKCLCRCGNIKNARGSSLRSGTIKSCGCIKKDLWTKIDNWNLIGKRIGKLVVIDRAGITKSRKSKWLCLCDCGITKVIISDNLIAETTKSCGCLQKEYYSSVLLPDNEAAFNTILWKYINGAKKRGYQFSLSKEQFKSLITTNCYYCGSDLSNLQSRKNSRSVFKYNGIDRVDNNIGYIISNVVSCCKQCNTMKMRYSVEDFFDKIKKIYEKHLKS